MYTVHTLKLFHHGSLLLIRPLQYILTVIIDFHDIIPHCKTASIQVQ
jgi:hypothetical protein